MLKKDEITAAVAAGFGGRVVETGLCDAIVAEIIKLPGMTDLDVEQELIVCYQKCTDEVRSLEILDRLRDLRLTKGSK